VSRLPDLNRCAARLGRQLCCPSAGSVLRTTGTFLNDLFSVRGEARDYVFTGKVGAFKPLSLFKPLF
jgi:hypothetical protein